LRWLITVQGLDRMEEFGLVDNYGAVAEKDAKPMI
jgi:hypothetical protein